MKLLFLLFIFFVSKIEAREVCTVLLEKLQSHGIPAEGVSIGNLNDKGTWRIDFKVETTKIQKDQAAQIIAAFNPISDVVPLKTEIQKIQEDIIILKQQILDLQAKTATK